MRHCLIICAALLASCGREEASLAPIPADLLVPCQGWTGSTPKTEGQFVSAALAEKRGREECNLKLESISEIVAGPK